MNQYKIILKRIWNDVKQWKWFIVGFALYYFIAHYFFHAYCPMLLSTGIPCPGCGMTRSIFFILTFRFVRAWNMNPAGYLWALFFLMFGLQRYVRGKQIKKLTPLLVFALIVTIGLYGYRMLLFYPGVPPMVFRENNLINQIFPRYNDLIKSILW